MLQLHPTDGRMVVLAPVGSWIVTETRPETGRAVAYCRVSSAGGGAYSHLVAWQLAVLTIAVIGCAFTTAVETGSKSWFVLPGVLSAVLLASLAYGSVRAECARRYGWLW